MATTKLKLYNGALLICGASAISSLTVNEEKRHLLDLVWDDNGVRYCLSQAQWLFAMRSSQFSYETDVEPAFGLRRAFEKPTDWVATSAVCSDPYFKAPLLQYADEVSHWYADIDDIYVRYVSDDTDYGADYSKWPETFTEYVKHYFAGKIIRKLPGGQDRVVELLGPSGRPDKGAVHAALMTAKNRDAMKGPTQFPPRGTWSGARGTRSWVNDRGNPGSLTG